MAPRNCGAKSNLYSLLPLAGEIQFINSYWKEINTQ